MFLKLGTEIWKSRDAAFTLVEWHRNHHFHREHTKLVENRFMKMIYQIIYLSHSSSQVLQFHLNCNTWNPQFLINHFHMLFQETLFLRSANPDSMHNGCGSRCWWSAVSYSFLPTSCKLCKLQVELEDSVAKYMRWALNENRRKTTLQTIGSRSRYHHQRNHVFPFNMHLRMGDSRG